MKLYCLSGLGVDHRAFQNLQLEGVEMVHIAWIPPQKKESLKSYAQRLFESQNIPEDYNLIGVSFGGMIAQEFAKIRKPKNLFLISTIRNKSELPFKLKIAGNLRLDKIAPILLLKSGNALTYYFFGVKKVEDKALLKQILKDTNGKFLRWAMRAILNWDKTENVGGTSIHGTKDRILKNHSTEHPILGAGHFMIVTHADEVKDAVMKNWL
ncbi:alpha/beta hydrolase [Paracrocinitomix mangrovi]|uniref:alpha/beta hydrolase n=1 Tax=Paracrocinitomix mangrovi TaxID=2862509 RepID=UPI001C8D32A1|nr:alpha/beta hydrolase [Paracrocinitomix mangrovi]UKN02731.1 alpha/beta hydrolase [Paracrocinitomix mangrovi]